MYIETQSNATIGAAISYIEKGVNSNLGDGNNNMDSWAISSMCVGDPLCVCYQFFCSCKGTGCVGRVG